MAVAPLWYTAVSAVQVNSPPALTANVSVSAPETPPALHLGVSADQVLLPCRGRDAP